MTIKLPKTSSAMRYKNAEYLVKTQKKSNPKNKQEEYSVVTFEKVLAKINKSLSQKQRDFMPLVLNQLFETTNLIGSLSYHRKDKTFIKKQVKVSEEESLYLEVKRTQRHLTFHFDPNAYDVEQNKSGWWVDELNSKPSMTNFKVIFDLKTGDVACDFKYALNPFNITEEEKVAYFLESNKPLKLKREVLNTRYSAFDKFNHYSSMYGSSLQKALMGIWK